MNNIFSFKTDHIAYQFCIDIVSKMIHDFGITYEEAELRINSRWGILNEINEDDMIFHETVEYWAYDIYYGHESNWWSRLNDATLKPVSIN